MSINELCKEHYSILVVAQLVDWSHPTPDMPSSNSAIGQFYLLSSVFNLLRRNENKEEEAESGPF